MKPILIAISALVAGVLLSVLAPQIPQSARGLLTSTGLVTASGVDARATPAASEAGHGASGEAEGTLRMDAARIETARISLATVEAGTLSRHLVVPGVIVPDRNTIWRIAAKVVGTVAELRKGLGDEVRPGEVLAILDSREVAEAKSEYVGAQVNFGLQKTLFEREETLWQRRIQAEQQYLKARNAFTEAQLRVHLARQKLSALGVSDQEVSGLSMQTVNGLQRYEIRSPGGGRVVERIVDLGAPVGGEGQAKELFVIVDLTSVWVELTVSTADLAEIKEGNRVRISAGGTDRRSEGKVVFISPLLNQDTRSARVIAVIDNKDHGWRPGSFVNAEVAIEEARVDIRVPRAALQTMEGSPVLFVRTETGFERRKVVVGKEDDQFVEIAFGVDAGEVIAVSNTFLLKAELGKAEAEHSH
ncbi:efflux RND transporter periplasmic adaptor subunit [Phreatobacter stygius]|uniref:Efflux RND transporter periplasmic adaptor subunit n=1 Tax=Phreatobacter stygius TaxID=1940610 RepID=A0A4D7B2I2_9HYPH|nr:efflux RND transporter periplasmic adaptor subunit [Phreatobacter stygius]QCI64808.1 efflux RND transporter periplasmic adaptor subunit [Phreatobacter stygius]